MPPLFFNISNVAFVLPNTARRDTYYGLNTMARSLTFDKYCLTLSY